MESTGLRSCAALNHSPARRQKPWDKDVQEEMLLAQEFLYMTIFASVKWGQELLRRENEMMCVEALQT